MSNDTFLARWSRLKQERAAQKDKKGGAAIPAGEPAPAPDGTEVVAGGGDKAAASAKAPEPEFDVSSLPPIEEITAGTDIRAFLQSGVPTELTKAALRRAWTADPAIRDFIGLAENQWDFTDPSSIPGFGPLGPVDDVRQLVAGAMGRLDELAGVAESRDASQQPESGSTCATADPEAPAQSAAAQQEKQHSASSPAQVEPQDETATAASHHVDASPEPQMIRGRRSHGGALPQ
jgi:hypothetical protein